MNIIAKKKCEEKYKKKNNQEVQRDLQSSKGNRLRLKDVGDF